MIITIIGGSASGKSGIAEDMICRLAGDKNKYYIATMQVTEDDEEGIKRVEKHRDQRKDKDFVTIECPHGLGNALDRMNDKESKNILLECMSNLVANEMFFGSEIIDKDTTVSNVSEGIKNLVKECENIVFVTNNVAEDGRNYDATTMSYIEALGQINAMLFDMSDEAYEAVVGIPVRIK